MPKTRVKGSFGIELVLWLCFLLPGLIYSIWRLTTKEQACPSCGSTALVPPGSPTGQQITRQSNQSAGSSGAAPDITAQLESLEGLRERGTISEDDFNKLKLKILGEAPD